MNSFKGPDKIILQILQQKSGKPWVPLSGHSSFFFKYPTTSWGQISIKSSNKNKLDFCSEKNHHLKVEPILAEVHSGAVAWGVFRTHSHAPGLCERPCLWDVGLVRMLSESKNQWPGWPLYPGGKMLVYYTLGPAETKPWVTLYKPSLSFVTASKQDPNCKSELVWSILVVGVILASSMSNRTYVK